jgi:threonine/homoserine/homoserine lactone efflux protein
MNWPTYISFLVFAVILVLIPGPDFAVVTKNALAPVRRRGAWAAAGVASSNAVQGAVAVLGLGAAIAASQPVFTAIKWAGVVYLVFLGAQALTSAVKGHQPTPDAAPDRGARKDALAGWRQGFLSNITNPKVLVFYLAVLPQFLPHSAPAWHMMPLALSHAMLSLAYLLLVVAGVRRARILLSGRRVRRTLDAVTGLALLGFGVRVARENA